MPKLFKDSKYLTSQGYLPALAGFPHADKVTHAIYGTAIFFITLYCANWYGFNGIRLGLAVTFIIAGAKEAVDEFIRGEKWDIYDIIATVFPALLIALYLEFGQ
ncbi:hypothetical protein [Flocculibacter collagenilyticus]|uniref:hypothetical protein n=1 Tax=Flocculibacter collagenilyticus TaxID=2744479 RepID=UPI0018F4CEAA|nr:hypothetical protein [Flocculibacter collagenilyticus]